MAPERTIYERELQDEAENLAKLRKEQAELEAEHAQVRSREMALMMDLQRVERQIARSEAITETVKRLMDMLE